MDISQPRRRPPPRSSLPVPPVASPATPDTPRESAPRPIATVQNPGGFSASTALPPADHAPRQDPDHHARESRISARFSAMMGKLVARSPQLLDVRTHVMKGKVSPVLASVIDGASHAHGAGLDVKDYCDLLKSAGTTASIAHLPSLVDDVIFLTALKSVCVEAGDDGVSEALAAADLLEGSFGQIDDTLAALRSTMLADVQRVILSRDGANLISLWLERLASLQPHDTREALQSVCLAFQRELRKILAEDPEVPCDPEALVSAFIILVANDRFDCWQDIVTAHDLPLATEAKFVFVDFLNNLKEMAAGFSDESDQHASRDGKILSEHLLAIRARIQSCFSGQREMGQRLLQVLEAVLADVRQAALLTPGHWNTAMQAIGEHALHRVRELCQTPVANPDDMVFRV